MIIGGEEFQRHLSFELGVLCFVNDAHAALAELVENLVMEIGFADHLLLTILFVKSVDLNSFEEAGFVNFPKVEKITC